MNFEDKVKELEEIARQISQPEVTLDESIELYEKSIQKAKECIVILNDNKEKIDNLSKQMDALFNGEENV